MSQRYGSASLRIVHALPSDLEEIMALVRQAQDFMIAHGNPQQWGRSYPDEGIIREDLQAGRAFKVLHDGEIVGYYVLFDFEPSYETVYGGSWLNDEPYICVHRVMTRQGMGVGRFLLEHIKDEYENVRIDTMRENQPMRSLLRALSFVEVGEVEIFGRGRRVAYHFAGGGG